MSVLDKVITGLRLDKQVLGLANRIKRRGTLLDTATFMKTLAQTLGYGANAGALLQPYKDSVWIYAAVNAIANNLAKVPIKLFERGTSNLVTSGNVYQLLEKPNPITTRLNFIKAIVVFLELYGEDFIILDNQPNTPTDVDAMWTFNPSRFTPLYNKNLGAVVGWRYQKGAKYEDFPMSRIRMSKYTNPYDDVRGMSPISAAAMGIQQDFWTSQFNANYFKEGVRLSGFVSVPTELTTEQFDRFFKQLNDKYSGYTRAHRVAILENNASFTESKMSHKDMEFSLLKKMSREEIFGVYKVNEVVLGLYDEVQSYEGIKTAHKAFWEECLMPRILHLEDFFNTDVLSVIEGGRYEIKFDLASVGALHEDYSARVTTAKSMVSIGFPLNDVNKRLELGMKDVPWGNVWWVPMGTMPADQIMAGNTGTDNTDDKPLDSETPSVSDDDTPGTQEPNTQTDADKAIWQRFLAVQLRLEDLTRSRVKRFIFEQRKFVLENVYSNKSAMFNVSKEITRLQRLLGAIYIEGMRIGAEMINSEINSEISDNTVIDFDLSSPEIATYVKARLSIIPKSIIGVVERQLTKAIKNHTTKEDIADAVRTAYNTVSKRINVIARTESSAVIVVGRIIHMQRLNVRYHKWINSKLDSGGRETHKSYNGKIVRIDESFTEDYTLRYPGDLLAPPEAVIGCRCLTIMAVDAIKSKNYVGGLYV